MKLNVNENSFCCFSKNKYKRVGLKNCLQSTTDVIGAKHQEDQMKLVFLYYDFFFKEGKVKFLRKKCYKSIKSHNKRNNLNKHYLIF